MTTTEKNTKKKSAKKTLRILYIALGLCAASVLIFGIWLGTDVLLERQSRNHYTMLATGVETRPRNFSAAPLSDSVSAPTGGDVQARITSEPWMAYMDFEALGARISALTGWIRLEGTAIDYPIVQWTDNYFFLGHLPDGTKHRSGSIFVDYRNNPDLSDKNTMIYGHMSQTDDMFGALKYLRNQTFFDEHNIIYIYTPHADFALMLFSVYLVDSGVETPPISFKDDEGFLRHVAETKRRSIVQSDVEVGADDRIVSLATCAYDFANARLVVVGKLVQFGGVE
ncbi:MAG: class B sortase [Oscillospiraceae bacterium]|nr:class B sortase [Oscillospiraceae bacterium]